MTGSQIKVISFWISYFFHKISFGSCALQHRLLCWLGTGLQVGAMLASRWLLLASFLDRRRAMVEPVIYRSIDQVQVLDGTHKIDT